ncbi:MAG TPA: GNAT family N-acetyltransferase, partial [Gemmatimonadaceae bacterium]|nr:GNAT family N-acetyltransferase [Gemmatimonadaceae bacterium]
MKIEIVQEPGTPLAEYASIPSAFEVKRVMEVTREGSLITLTERETERRIKDYDVSPGEGPASWPKRFEMSGWKFFAALLDGKRVGGAAVVARSDAVELLEGRSDLALLWDIRVAPAARRTGVGSALVQGVERWARGQRIATIKVETQ